MIREIICISRKNPSFYSNKFLFHYEIEQRPSYLSTFYLSNPLIHSTRRIRQTKFCDRGAKRSNRDNTRAFDICDETITISFIVIINGNTFELCVILENGDACAQRIPTKYIAASSCTTRYFTTRGSFVHIHSSNGIPRICNNTSHCLRFVYASLATSSRVCPRGASYAVAHIFYFLLLRKIHAKGLNSKFVNDSRHRRRDIRAECIHENDFPRRMPFLRGHCEKWNAEMSLFLFSKVGRYFKISQTLLFYDS